MVLGQICILLYIQFYVLSAPGPVRNLQCTYDALKEQALSCKWREPEKVSTPIQIYQVKIISRGKVIQQMSTRVLKFYSADKLRRGEKNSVSVRAITPTMGDVAETRVNFLNSGESSFTC